MASVKKKIEEEHGRTLTSRQMTFARHVVEGIYSNAECARKAGYAPDVSRKQASVLLNGRDYPHVVEYIAEVREERERRYSVSTIGQLQRLQELSQGAEEAGQFSAAINAEKIRSALKELYSFEGDQGANLLRGGVSAAQGTRFANPAALFESLRPRLLAHYSATLRPSP